MKIKTYDVMLDMSIQEMTGRTCGNNLVNINSARVGLNGGF